MRSPPLSAGSWFLRRRDEDKNNRRLTYRPLRETILDGPASSLEEDDAKSPLSAGSWFLRRRDEDKNSLRLTYRPLRETILDGPASALDEDDAKSLRRPGPGSSGVAMEARIAYD